MRAVKCLLLVLTASRDRCLEVAVESPVLQLIYVSALDLDGLDGRGSPNATNLRHAPTSPRYGGISVANTPWLPLQAERFLAVPRPP